MGARENILARIRRQQGRAGPTSDEEMAQVRAHIRQPERGPQPLASRVADAESKFIEECGRLLTTVGQCSEAALPVEVARYLESHGLERRIAGWPAHAGLDWQAAGLRYEARAARADDTVGLTGCFCAIAETGTLFMLSSPEQPKLNALLPETHVCVVPRSRIVPTMEDAFALMRQEVGEPPRAMFFASGPSRTADIEQTIVIGAHGPYRVHVILV